MNMTIRGAPAIKHELDRMEVQDVKVACATQYRKLQESLREVLRLLGPENMYDEEELVNLGLSEENFVEPLNKHEVIALATAISVANRERRGMIYRDVLQLTKRYNGRPMNLTMVYRTIERLLARGMLTQGEVSLEGERAQSYTVTQHGRDAFKLAILNAQILKRIPSSVAA